MVGTYRTCHTDEVMAETLVACEAALHAVKENGLV
jgi:hypothetical protein